MRTSGTVPIVAEDLFGVCVTLKQLSQELTRGFQEKQFAQSWEKELVVDRLAIDVVVAGIIAQLVGQIDEATNRALAHYCAEKFSVEYEDGLIFEPIPQVVHNERVIQLPKTVLFHAYGALIEYDKWEEDSDPNAVTPRKDLHAFVEAQLCGSAQFDHARKLLERFIFSRKKLPELYEQYMRTHSLDLPDIWI